MLPGITLATNGSLLIGYGAKSRSMGGAGVAFAQDALVSAVNPAGMTDVGNRFDAGLMIFHPKRSAYVPGFSGRDNIQSGSEWFAIPNMGANYRFNRKVSMGFAFVGSGGGNTRYNENFFDFSGDPNPTLGVNLMQAVMSPSLAYKVDKHNSIGASVLLGLQSFRAYGLEAFGDAGFSSDPEHLTGNGNEMSYGAGLRFGWRGKFFDDFLTLGASYSSRVYMTKFDKYKGLFAEHGDADMPAMYTLGLAIKPIDKVTVAFDYQHVDYSSIKSFSNHGPKVFLPLPKEKHLMGEDEGLGFGWRDMDVYKIGISYDYSDRYTFRAGYNYGTKPMPGNGVEILANTLAPAVTEHHATLGMSYRPDKNMEWSIAAMYAFRKDVVEFNEFSNDNIRISMHQYAGEISFGYKF
jgi:long-chain fatty acid transport protein